MFRCQDPFFPLYFYFFAEGDTLPHVLYMCAGETRADVAEIANRTHAGIKRSGCQQTSSQHLPLVGHTTLSVRRPRHQECAATFSARVGTVER